MPRVLGVLRRLSIVALFAASAGGETAAAPLVVYCTHDPDACDLASQTFTHDTGITVAMTRKPMGEVYAQPRAERDDPKADLWYGGTFDSFLQGAAEGLFASYRSPELGRLRPWATKKRLLARWQSEIGDALR